MITTVLAVAQDATNRPLTVTNIDDTDVSAIEFSGSGWQVFSALGKTHHHGTATSSSTPRDAFIYGNSACTRLRWFATKSIDRGMADVYVDGVRKLTVDLYAAKIQDSDAVFDTGVLPMGTHTLRVVVKAERNAAATGSWVECDKVEVTHDMQKSNAPMEPRVVSADDKKVMYFGNWSEARNASGEPVRLSDRPYSACVLVFKGPTVRWLGGKGPDHGQADVYLDDRLERTVDSYAPTSEVAQVLFDKTGLATQRLHTLRLEVRREKQPNATGHAQRIVGFEVSEALNYPQVIQRSAAAELTAIAAGTKPYLAPETWKPVAYGATAPAKGVTLEPGPLRDCFDRNIAYLNHCFAKPGYNDGGENEWAKGYPASSEGRLLAGAGHTLRWGERADMRAIVDTIVGKVKSRQTKDGWCLPYDPSYMNPQKEPWADERRNYDRVGLTRGLIAAGMAGNPDALGILRRFYDWLNPSPYYAKLLTGTFSDSAHNCNNGHAGGLLMYLSSAGKQEDLIAVERCFVQDFFLEQAANNEPLALGFYPLHTPHSYVLLAFESWLDHYRATGATKYLDAAKGAWRIVNGSYEHIGGTIAICEEGIGAYPPKSYYLGKHTGETCGSVFWAETNHRFLQLFPAETKYADEIEHAIYNVLLASQSANGSIRYHNNLHGSKEGPQCANTCCEVMGVPFIARLPQYLYSVANDGIYVNLLAASAIDWTQDGQPVMLRTETEFPASGKVALKLTAAKPVRMKVRIRVPSWAGGTLPVNVNGVVAATGTSGSYVEIDRSWSNHDTVSFELPMEFRLVKYTGFDQDANHDRYALLRGPLLMALVGATDLNIAAGELPGRLAPVANNPLSFSVTGAPNCRYLPYWQIQAETFTCFPTMR